MFVHFLFVFSLPVAEESTLRYDSIIISLSSLLNYHYSLCSNIDGAMDQPSASNTEFPTPLHPRHRLLRRNSETESTGRVSSKEDVLSASMNAAADLQHNLQAMSSGSHTESHEDMLRSSHLAGSEDELNLISKDHSLSNSDLTKYVHRMPDSNQQNGKDASIQIVAERSYTDSPIEFSQCPASNYSVKVVDINKAHRVGMQNSGLDDNEELMASGHSQDSTGSMKSFHATTKDSRAHTVVIPRGQKGFGIFLVEGEVGNIIIIYSVIYNYAL